MIFAMAVRKLIKELCHLSASWGYLFVIAPPPHPQLEITHYKIKTAKYFIKITSSSKILWSFKVSKQIV